MRIDSLLTRTRSPPTIHAGQAAMSSNVNRHLPIGTTWTIRRSTIQRGIAHGTAAPTSADWHACLHHRTLLAPLGATGAVDADAATKLQVKVLSHHYPTD
jgi:NADH:ubiquinone oxidoreductase subunit